MDRERKDCVVVLAVHPVELVPPHLLDVARADPAVTIGRLLDEHHGGKIVHVPVPRELDDVYLPPSLQRFHPSSGGPLVVDLRPLLADTSVGRLKVMVSLTMVVLESVLQENFKCGWRNLPPRC